MCGVIGFVDKKRSLSVQEGKLLMKKMLDEIAYRGRDTSGIYENKVVFIGHNRLSILDFSDKANQPLLTENKELLISYNGEIFNHLEIRNRESKYDTHSDTETFLYGYKKFANKFFGMIRGMFAVSFYNTVSSKIILSVDAFGIKPLYYINTDDWFAWASELKVFRHLDGIKFSLEENHLFEYGVFRIVAGSETMLKGIYKVMPSEIIEYDIAEDFLMHDRYLLDTEKEKLDIEHLLAQSVSEHILSDALVGFQLSGGVDSSLISILGKKFLKQKEVHSFSIGLKDEKWNEFQYSKEVSEMLQTQHHEIIFDQKDFCEQYPIATYHLDEPVSYPNTVPMMLLSKFASNYVNVLLSGEGADELFGGYKRYAKIINGDHSNNAILFSNSFCSPVDIQQFLNIKKSQIIYRDTFVSQIDDKSIMQKLSYYDLSTYLPSLLLRQDKMGMASTIENRFPFLDPRLVHSALNLPDSDKNDGLKSKIVLKDIASKYLPQHVAFRKKCGFGLPISEWLRDAEGLGKYLQFFTKPDIKRDYFNYQNIQTAIDEHFNRERDNSEVLWILVSLEVWTKIFIDGENPKTIWLSL
jgi:asparagine synthase (glutamine-hydrolysing)